MGVGCQSLRPVLSLPAPPTPFLSPISVCKPCQLPSPETSRPASRAGQPLGLETASGIGFLGGLRGAVGTQGQPGRPGSPGSARERRREALGLRDPPAPSRTHFVLEAQVLQGGARRPLYSPGTAVTLGLWAGEPVHRLPVLERG